MRRRLHVHIGFHQILVIQVLDEVADFMIVQFKDVIESFILLNRFLPLVDSFLQDCLYFCPRVRMFKVLNHTLYAEKSLLMVRAGLIVTEERLNNSRV